MMIDPPIGELLEKVDCRYTLAVEASKRARELIGGSMPLIDTKDTNPLTIAGATFLLLAFTKLRVKGCNRLIGILATASFAVYVLHCTAPFTETVYQPIVKDIYKNYSGIACPLLIFSAMCCVYLLCTLLDQARQWCWKQLTRAVPWLAGAKAE